MATNLQLGRRLCYCRVSPWITITRWQLSWGCWLPSACCTFCWKNSRREQRWSQLAMRERPPEALNIEVTAHEDSPVGIFTQVASRTLRPSELPRPTSAVLYELEGHRATRVEAGTKYRLELRWD